MNWHDGGQRTLRRFFPAVLLTFLLGTTIAHAQSAELRERTKKAVLNYKYDCFFKS